MSAGRVPGRSGTGASASDANSWKQLKTALGVALSGQSAGYGVMFEEFDKGQVITGSWNLIAGTVNGSQTNRSSAHCDTGATAGSVAILELSTNGAALGLNAATDKWYMAFRAAALTSTFNSTTLMGVGVANKARTSSIVFGVAAAGANFACQYDGNFNVATILDSGKVLDTAMHDFELWCAGNSTLNIRIDGGSTVTHALASPPTTMYPIIYCFNGSGAVSHQLDVDKILMLFPQA